MIKCYPFTKTVQASAMKACFRIAERCLSSAKIQNLAPPLQVFREENEMVYVFVRMLFWDQACHVDSYSGLYMIDTYHFSFCCVESLPDENIRNSW